MCGGGRGAWLTDHRLILNLVTLLVLRRLLDPRNLLLLLHRLPGRLHPGLGLPAVTLWNKSHDQRWVNGGEPFTNM